MLRLSTEAHTALVAHAFACLPEEMCGLLIGTVDGSDTTAEAFHPCRNAAQSSRVYTVDPRDYMAADRAAEDAEQMIVGVAHSHTHTDPYPSPTDVDQAPDPDWQYLIVSLRHATPSTRSYRIVDGAVTEEQVELYDC